MLQAYAYIGLESKDNSVSNWFIMNVVRATFLRMSQTFQASKGNKNERGTGEEEEEEDLFTFNDTKGYKNERGTENDKNERGKIRTIFRVQGLEYVPKRVSP